MKIAVLCATSLEYLPIDRRVLNQCEIFADEGWDVYLVLGSHEPNNSLKLYDYMEMEIFPLPLTRVAREQSLQLVNKVTSIDLDEYQSHALPKTLLLSQHLFEMKDIPRSPPVLDRYMYTFPFLRSLEEIKPDAVYSADYQGMVAAYLYYKKTQTPYVIDSHEFCLSHATSSTRDSKFIRALESICFSDTTELLTVSHDFRSLYMLEYGTSINPSVYYNVPKDYSESEQSIGEIRKVIKISDDSKIVLFHGGLSLGKRNLELLIESAPLLIKDNIHILFVGYGPLSEIIPKLGIENVHYLKPLSQDILQQLVRQINLIVVPYAALDINQLFCAPNRIFDAISTSTPILFNKRIISLQNLDKKFGIAQEASMTNKSEMAQAIRSAMANEMIMRKAYVDHKDELSALYSFSTQRDSIKQVSLRLKSKVTEQTGLSITNEVKSFYLESIVDYLKQEETYNLGIELACKLIDILPNSEDAVSLKPLIRKDR